MKRLIAAALAAIIPGAALAADGMTTYAYDGSFEDATFAVESEIVGRGFVVDYVSHVGQMLARTKADVGGTKDVFTNADVFLFCSAVLSRKMMEADPMNIAYCPYAIFVAEQVEGEPVTIGYRTMPEGPMKEVEATLDEIVRAAVGE